MHPLTEPYRQGMLDVGDGQRVYWECCGSPDGQPAVVLHGGPGSGAAPWWRGFFDPGRYRVVLLDQRGAGLGAPRWDSGMPCSTLSGSARWCCSP